MALLVIILCLFIIAAICLYFYSIAFIRRSGADIENFQSVVGKTLLPHKKEIERGYRYIDKQRFEEFSVVSFDGLRLFAKYFPNKNSKATIILFHGYRSSAKRDFSCAIEMYHRFGLNVLLVDQRSHGKSEGRLITFGMKERFDVLSWIKLVREKINNDEKIFLGGMSMGATTVLLSAELDLPSNVRGIIADSGFTSPVDIIKRVAKRDYGVSASPIIPIFNLICKIFGKFGLYDASAERAVANTNIPILFVHGKADSFVPCEMCVKNYDCTASQKEIILVDDANHGLGYFFDKSGIEQKVEQFINNHIDI